MKRQYFFRGAMMLLLVLFFAGCNSEVQKNTEDNSSEVAPMNGPIHASDFALRLDVNETVLRVNWIEKSSATSEDNGSIAAAINMQGLYGIFSLDGDTLVYVRQADGNATDRGVLRLTEGNSTVDVVVTVDRLVAEVAPMNGPIHASDFALRLDVNETVLRVNWIEKSSATSEDNGSIAAAINMQGLYGIFSLDGDTLVYVRQADGNATDRGVLRLTEGNSTVDVVVTVDRLYWKQVAAGYYYTMAIKNDGTLWGWGANAYGQLGDGTTVDRIAPVQVGTETHWEKVFAKFDHTMAIKSDGTLWGWGYNRYGQLGNGTASDKHFPTQEPTKATNWTDVGIGNYHTIAIKSDGTLWASGRNNYGQLGDNTTIDKHAFVAISASVTDWSGVAAGQYHSVAIRSDGTLWAWGHNNYGQLGDSTTTDRSIPTQETLLDDDWQKIAAGYSHSLAIKSDGSLYAWGYNGYGNLGDGTNTNRSTPTQEASGANDWVAVDGGNYHTVAIKSDSTLWGWGYNNLGQLSSRLNQRVYAPEMMDQEGGYWVVHASHTHTAALKNNGTVWLWGVSAGGQELR